MSRRGWFRSTRYRRAVSASTGIRYVRTLVTQLTYWPLLAEGLQHGRRRSRLFGVVLVVPAGSPSGGPGRAPAGKARRHELSQRRGARPSEAIGGRANACSGTSIATSCRRRSSRMSSLVWDRVSDHPNIVDVDRFAFRRREPLRPASAVDAEFRGPLQPAVHAARVSPSPGSVPGGFSDAGWRRDSRNRRPRARRRASASGRCGSPAECRRRTCGATTPTPTSTCRRPISTTCPRRSSKPSRAAVRWSRPMPEACRAILTNEVHGLLVPCDDHVGAAAAMRRLLDDARLSARLAETARESCGAYQWTSVRGQWLALYRGLAGSPALAAPGIA